MKSIDREVTVIYWARKYCDLFIRICVLLTKSAYPSIPEVYCFKSRHSLL